ncbi:MAG TPA: SdiA-regulated domain-containing protein, partial [Tepidisphaeraceae bacterium]
MIRSAVVATLGSGVFASIALAQVNSVDLSQYVRVGRYSLPNPSNTATPPNSVLAQEVSAVTYNKATDTLFVVGDGGTSIVQITKTGQLVNSMTLGTGNSPQNTFFYDPEGLTYVGNNQFVMVEERDRRANLITYAAGTTLGSAPPQTVVKLGTTIGNIGIEGMTFDPFTGGYIGVKETGPLGIFQ